MFFLFLSCYFQKKNIIPVVKENTRVKEALAIPTGAPIIVANDEIEMLPAVTDRTIRILSI